MGNILIDQLANAIANAVREYTEDVSEAIEQKVDVIANEVRDGAEHLAPKHTGKYSKGFKITKSGGRRIIWNKKDYRRVHLLEFGHAKLGGGRVRAFPHLRPAFDQYGAKLPEEIKRIIQNGGAT